MFLEKSDEFFLKRSFSMMFFLVGDIFLNLNQIGVTHTERTVADLPSERFLSWKVFVDPTSRVRLQLAHQIRQ